MILLFDIRNSSISISTVLVKDCCCLSWDSIGGKTVRFSASGFATPDDLLIRFDKICDMLDVDPEIINGAAVCSVVPSLTASVYEACTKKFGRSPFLVRPGIRSGIRIKTDDPGELGADILTDAVAVADGTSAIVADIGTATAVTAVSAESEILGTVILPGIGTSAEALRSCTPQILFRSPDIPSSTKADIIGKNTNDSVALGILRGTAFAIDGFFDLFAENLFADKKTRMFVTGFAAERVIPLLKSEYLFDPCLTFKGLYKLYKINTGLK